MLGFPAMGRRRFLADSLRALSLPLFLRTSARASALARHPYIQNTGIDRATIIWTTRENSAGEVVYSKDSALWRSRAAVTRPHTFEETESTSPCYRHQVELTGLEPNTRYFYRVQQDGSDLAPNEGLSFQTAGSGAFSFLVMGDSGMGSAEQSFLAKRLAQETCSFVVHTGDLVYPRGSFDGYEEHYFRIHRDLMKQRAFFPCPGNHEYMTAEALPYLAVHATPESGVPAADNGRYYSFDWSNAHFISIDSNTPLVEAATGKGQMISWLEADLAGTRKFWKIVYFHHPPFPTGRHRDDPLSALARDHLVPIFERHGVQVVLNGHEHNYQRSHPIRGGDVASDSSGTIYVTTGGGGANLYEAPANKLMAVAKAEHHYLRIRVDGHKMEVQAVGLDGREIDDFSLRPTPWIDPAGALNAASGTAGLSSGAFFSISGRNLAADNAVAKETPLPTELAGVSVSANGVRLPLLFVSPHQINSQIPFAAAGEILLRVQTDAGSAETKLKLSDAAPGIFVVARPHGELITEKAPARPGEWLVAYANGLGPVRAATFGENAFARCALSVEVHIGATAVTPSFAGFTPGFPGLYQVNFLVPTGLTGRQSMSIKAGHATSNALEVAFATN